MTTLRTFLVLPIFAAFASVATAADFNGTLKVGGISVDQTGDRSIVQETYNLFDGFSIHQFYLHGTPTGSDRLILDIREPNLDSRRGSFSYRMPGFLKLSGGFDQNWRVYDADATRKTRRRDWKVAGVFSPAKGLALSANYNSQSRNGDRFAYPAGTMGSLGTKSDNLLQTGSVVVRGQQGKFGGAVALNFSDYSNSLDSGGDRTGQLVSARFHATGFLYDRWTHLFRAARGVRQLSYEQPDHTLSSFQYTGVVAPVDMFEFKYGFDANRVEDESTDLQTDRLENSFDGTIYHDFGQLSGGYVYETNDDDRSLTHYHGWRAGTVFRYDKYLTARVNYAGRIKRDLEELTLLRDAESNRIKARVQVRPIDAVEFGGGYSWRRREFPDIDVSSEGDVVNAFARLRYNDWGTASAEYSYTDDSYEDRIDGFDTTSDVLTGRLSFDRVKDLRLAAGLTYLEIGGDLDIEKTLVFVEGEYTILDDYHLEFRYNAYNYDDFILVDRYYTANVLWFSFGYDFNLK